jgi:hypothetical protein
MPERLEGGMTEAIHGFLAFSPTSENPDTPPIPHCIPLMLRTGFMSVFTTRVLG